MRYTLSFLICFLSLTLTAQTYSLQQCIDSALTNNISVRQQRNQYDVQRLQYSQQKQNLLPSVSGNVGQSWSFGRATGVDNITRSQNQSNTSFGLSANLLLFDGLGMKYRIDEARANSEASEAQMKKLETDIRMDITTMYLQSLLRKELLLVAQSQMEDTRQKLQQTEQLVAEGRLAEGEKYALEAQLAKEELSVVQAENDLHLAMLDLAQAMNINYSPDMDIMLIDEDERLLPDREEAYQQALQNRPEIRSAQAQLQASEYALKGAKSAYSPSLSAGVDLGTGYYHLYGADNTAFGQQLGDNFSTTVGLHLNIPIFDRMQTPNSVKQQKISIENYRLQIEQQKQTLKKEIDQAYYNALAARSQKQSAQKAALSATEALRYAEKKYEAGRASVYELYDAKNTYLQAQSTLLQSKYEYSFKVRILEYYMSE